MNRVVSSIAVALCAVGFFAQSTQATILSYQTFLSGPAESPPNASPGTGFATLDYDDVAHTAHLNVTFSGLIGTTTASHIHGVTAVPFAGTAGVATTTPTFAGFPLGVTAGVYDITLNMTLASSYNPSFVTAQGGISNAETALMGAVATGRAYLNIHSSVFGGGEIRGFWTPVPEPASLTLLAFGGALLVRRRRA